MNTVKFLSCVTVLALAASAVGLFLNVLPLPLFIGSIVAFLALIVAGDYSAPPRRWEPSLARTPVASGARAVQPLRLAA